MQRKIVLLIISIIVLFLIGMWQVAGRIGKIKVTIDASPRDSKIQIDGNKAKNGDNFITSGKHTFSASRKYFESATKTVDSNADTKVTLVASPNSIEGQQLLENTPGELDRRQVMVAAAARDRGSQAARENPFIAFLPIQHYVLGESYRIDYGPPKEGTNQPIILITADTPALRSAALGYIKDLGYNPSDMNIVFKGVNTGFGTEDN